MPVGVSGPGAMATRTDRQPMRDVTGLPYGEGQALREQQGGAPMAATPSVPMPTATALSAPTERTGQPVTAGAALGPGPGVEALQNTAVGMPSGGAISQALARVAAVDNSGVFAQLLQAAQQKGL